MLARNQQRGDLGKVFGFHMGPFERPFLSRLKVQICRRSMPCPTF